MASQAQIDANRRNALHSTGPKTNEGKETTGRNALKHGLCAERAVVLDESAADFAEFSAGLHRALAPADEYETALVERIVHIDWRLRRAWRIEAAAFEEEALTLDRERARRAARVALETRLDDVPPERKQKEVEAYAANLDDDQLASYADPIPRDGAIWPNRLDKIARYEAALERQLHRATLVLECRQSLRRAAERPPAPAPKPAARKLAPPPPRIAPPAFAIGQAAKQTQFSPPPPVNGAASGNEIASLRSQ
jgi:hypothetical protein